MSKWNMDNNEHHVHFDDNDIVCHSNDVTVKQGVRGSIDIHVGFLQVFHKYEVTVAIPLSYVPNASAKSLSPYVPDIPQPFGR